MAAGSSCHCRKSAFSLAAGSPPCSRAVPGTGGSEAQAEPILPPWQRPRLPEQLRSGERLTCAGVRRSRRARAPPCCCSRCRERPPALPPLRSAAQRARLRTVGISRIRGKLLEGQKDCPQELAYAVPLEGERRICKVSRQLDVSYLDSQCGKASRRSPCPAQHRRAERDLPPPAQGSAASLQPCPGQEGCEGNSRGGGSLPARLPAPEGAAGLPEMPAGVAQGAQRLNVWKRKKSASPGRRGAQLRSPGKRRGEPGLAGGPSAGPRHPPGVRELRASGLVYVNKLRLISFTTSCNPNEMNQLVNHLLKDQEEDPKEAKTRVPLKQLRRKQKPLAKSDPEAGPENGLNKWFRRSLLRKRLKKRPHKNRQRKTRRPHHAISTSSAVGSFEGRRHCLDHLFSIAMVFPLLPGGKKNNRITLKRI
ncbi:PREDICTED: uncharacterized protein LOC104828321 [Haliaeetus leucocephalus]|uniref:uncharacterized protein LOC104828321 n=1 Tax=Haliaeetus leucocephalus TaxID=52644 RepID=UPI00053CC70E|nr:PREDICTED: uncharacterized protein LOC104828321 [Haliaeetus leucocephalus]